MGRLGWGKKSTPVNKNILKDIGIVLLCVAVFGGISVAIVSWSVQLTTDGQDFMQSSRSFQAIATVTLICVGGIFAYRRLQLFRTFDPHLTISQEVSHRLIGDSYVHIYVTATLHNSSKVQVEIREGFFSLMKISPVSDEQVEEMYASVFIDEEYDDIPWPVLEQAPRIWGKGVLLVEPGEVHQEICEFIISKDTKSVIIYTHFRNLYSSTPEGWYTTTVYDIEERS